MRRTPYGFRCFSTSVLAPELFFLTFPVLKSPGTLYRKDMEGDGRTTYRISEAARELGISIEWLRKGEARGFFPPALRDRNGHRYYTEEDIERMRNRPTSRRSQELPSESPEGSSGESGSSKTGRGDRRV